MIMRTTLFYSAFVGFLSLFLIACEGNTRMEWSIHNQSSSSLTVIHDAWDYAFLDPETLVISPGELLLIGANDVLGGQPNAWEPSSFIDTLFIYNDAGSMCTKDWQEMDNWLIETEELKKVPANWQHTYLLSVSDADF